LNIEKKLKDFSKGAERLEQEYKKKPKDPGTETG